MKGPIYGKMSPKISIYTCISTCEKGKYKNHQLEAGWGSNYQMLLKSNDMKYLKKYRGNQ